MVKEHMMDSNGTETLGAVEKKMFSGEVISDKMDKTVVVKTVFVYRHPKFGKTIKKYKNYKVHDENSVAAMGDKIEFFETRPISKTKYMMLHRVINKAFAI